MKTHDHITEIMGLLDAIESDTRPIEDHSDPDALRVCFLGIREALAQIKNDDEREILKVIDERDRAEEALSDAYNIVIGHQVEWSSAFGHADALREITDKMESI